MIITKSLILTAALLTASFLPVDLQKSPMPLRTIKYNKTAIIEPAPATPKDTEKHNMNVSAAVTTKKVAAHKESFAPVKPKEIIVNRDKTYEQCKDEAFLRVYKKINSGFSNLEKIEAIDIEIDV